MFQQAVVTVANLIKVTLKIRYTVAEHKISKMQVSIVLADSAKRSEKIEVKADTSASPHSLRNYTTVSGELVQVIDVN